MGILGTVYGPLSTGPHLSLTLMLTVYTVALLCPGHLRSIPIMSTNGGIAIFSFLRLCLICHHRRLVNYSVCAFISCFFKSLSISLYRFQSASFLPLFEFAMSRFLLRMTRRMLLFTHGNLPFCLCFFVSLFSTRCVA